MAAPRKQSGSKRRSRGIPVDILARAARADRETIAKMSMADRFELTIALSEFAVRNAGTARRR